VLGPVPDPDLPPLVAAAAAFAFPSVKEGFGLAAMEALAAGVPTVVSDLPVLRQAGHGPAHLAGVQAADEDRGTLLQEPLRGRQPDPAAAAADQDPPSG